MKKLLLLLLLLPCLAWAVDPMQTTMPPTPDNTIYRNYLQTAIRYSDDAHTSKGAKWAFLVRTFAYDQWMQIVSTSDTWELQGDAWVCPNGFKWSADGFSCVADNNPPPESTPDCSKMVDQLAEGGGCVNGCSTILRIGIGAGAVTGDFYDGMKCEAGSSAGDANKTNSTYPNGAPADVKDVNGNVCNANGCTCAAGYAPGTVSFGGGPEKWICAKSSASQGGSAGTAGKPGLPTDGTKPVPGQAPDDGGGGDHGSATPDKTIPIDTASGPGTGGTIKIFKGPSETGSGSGSGTGGTPSQSGTADASDICKANPNAVMCKPATGPTTDASQLYKGKGGKMSDKWDAFAAAVGSAPIINSGRAFFTLGGISGSCPRWTYYVAPLKTSITFDVWCMSEVAAALALVGPVLMAFAAWSAFKIAVL